MSTLKKPENREMMTPNRLPKRMKNFKRWRMSISEIENYIQNITYFDKDFDYLEAT